jgi:hypothetical protein
MMEGFQMTGTRKPVPLIFRGSVLQLTADQRGTVAYIVGGKFCTSSKYYAFVLPEGSAMAKLIPISNLQPPNDDGNFPAVVRAICKIDTVEFKRVAEAASETELHRQFLLLNPDRQKQQANVGSSKGRKRKQTEYFEPASGSKKGVQVVPSEGGPVRR